MELLGDLSHVKSHFDTFGESVVVLQDRCTVCAKNSIGQEIVLDAPMVLLGDEAQVESRFGVFGDSANLHGR